MSLKELLDSLPTVYIDTREDRNSSKTPNRATSLQSFFPKTELKMLEIGDVVCGNSVIELKEPEDFLSSLEDGRLFEQALNMQENFPSRHIYVLGSLQDIMSANTKKNPDGSIKINPRTNLPATRFHVNAIYGALSSLSENYSCNVSFIPNIAMLARLLAYTFKKANNDGTQAGHMRKRRRSTIKDQQINNICSLPGIGPKTANNMLKYAGSIRKFYTLTPEQLQEIDKIGEKTSESITNLLDKKYEETDDEK